MSSLLMFLAQDEGGGSGGSAGIIGGIIGGLFGLVIAVLMIASMWRIYAKAGQPGWAAIVPIYNLIVLLRIVNKPLWWIVLFMIPIANLVAVFVIYTALANAFGKGTGYGILMIFFPYFLLPHLAFSDATYVGTGAPGGFGGGYGAPVGYAAPGGYAPQPGYGPPPGQGGYPPQGGGYPPQGGGFGQGGQGGFGQG